MSDNIIELRTEFSNEFRCILYDDESTMNVVHDTGWFPNLVMLNGLDTVGNLSGFVTYGSIGTGTTPPVNTSPQMDSWLASSSTSGVSNGVFTIVPAAPNYEYASIKSKRYNAGIGTGLITEIGLGSEGDGTNLYNRQLIPTPFNKTANQILDVLCQQTIWPPLGDTLADITVAGIVYNTITRGSLYLSTTYISPWGNMGIGGGGSHGYSGDISATVEGQPSGTFGTAVGTSWGVLPYTPGNHYIDFKLTYGLGNFNVGGIQAFKCSTNHCYYQTSFKDPLNADAPIPKTDIDIGDFTMRLSWAVH